MKSFLILFLVLCGLGFAQDNAYTGTIRGVVRDVDSQAPMSYATVQVLQDTTVIGGAYTDEAGRFEVTGLPVGRVDLAVGYLGYETVYLRSLLVTSGKDLILNVEMTEALLKTEAIEIKGAGKEGTLNTMSTVSARTLNMEEANRYAGSFGDPARMAGNLAGVGSGGDTRNDIIVRGNSPTALVWRLEGVDIPNPNHFSSQGANGGPISILNNNLLANSDFFTGAFPAEYSNANAAAFDLRLRNGNTAKRESMFQLGFNGFELMTEGPLGSNQNSSYIASYRYSTLAAFDAIGIQWPGVSGIPRFQDFSFKLNFNKTPIGRLTFFGVGGISGIESLESDLDKEDYLDTDNEVQGGDFRGDQRMGVVGAQNTLFLDSKSYLQTTVAFSHVYRNTEQDSLAPLDNKLIFPDYREEATENKATLAMVYNRKLNARHNLRTGFFLDQYMVDYVDSIRLHDIGIWYTNRDLTDQTTLIRPYAQWQWKINEALTLNAGVNGMLLTLDNQTAVEPRVGLKYALSKTQSVSAAYGIHHQLQPLLSYYYQDEEGRKTNEDLDFSRSQHYVVGYDWTPLPNYRVKVETYYQYLDQLAIDPVASSFSMINFGLNFGDVPRKSNLVNEGTAETYGLELTIERFLNKGFYFLATGSVFNSEYKPSDGKYRSTAFNSNYVANLLAGIERPVGARQKNTVFADLKIAIAGGIRYTPVDIAASRAAGTEILKEDEAYTKKTDPYFRPDIKFGYRLNAKTTSHEFALQIQNFINYENVQQLAYDRRTGNQFETLQIGFFPVVQYRFNF
jgi:hypothetical protein